MHICMHNLYLIPDSFKFFKGTNLVFLIAVSPATNMYQVLNKYWVMMDELFLSSFTSKVSVHSFRQL